MLTPRQSILWRKPTKPSAKNVQSAEKLADLEKLRLQAKQTKQALLTESRRTALYSSPAEKVQLHSSLWDVGSVQQVQRRLVQKEERKRDIRQCKEYQALGALLEQQAQQRDSRRQSQLRSFQEENRRAIENRSAERVRAKVREDSRDRQQLESHQRSHTPNVL